MLTIISSTDNKSVRDLAVIALDNNLCVSIGSYSWRIKRDLDDIILSTATKYPFKIWIAYTDDKAVGVALFNLTTMDLMFYVKAAYRRKGIATTLMASVELDNSTQQFRVYQGSTSSFYFFKKNGLYPKHH